MIEVVEGLAVAVRTIVGLGLAITIHILAIVGALMILPPAVVLMCVAVYVVIRSYLREVLFRRKGFLARRILQLFRINASIWLLAYMVHIAEPLTRLDFPWPQRQTFLTALSALMLSDIAALMAGDNQQQKG